MALPLGRLANTTGMDSSTRTLEHELDMVRSAIALVASGDAPSVQLASLRFGEQLIEPARQMALGTGVRVVPMWTIDEGGAGILIESIADE